MLFIGEALLGSRCLRVFGVASVTVAPHDSDLLHALHICLGSMLVAVISMDLALALLGDTLGWSRSAGNSKHLRAM